MPCREAFRFSAAVKGRDVAGVNWQAVMKEDAGDVAHSWGREWIVCVPTAAPRCATMIGVSGPHVEVRPHTAALTPRPGCALPHGRALCRWKLKCGHDFATFRPPSGSPPTSEYPTHGTVGPLPLSLPGIRHDLHCLRLNVARCSLDTRIAQYFNPLCDLELP